MADEVTTTIRVSRGRIRVNEGQHLHYFITCEGATPVFSLSCTHKTHFEARTLELARRNYEVVWPRSSADETPDQDGEFYTFSMSFLAAMKYTVRVELHDDTHTIVGDADGIVLDGDYESDSPTESYFETWKVFTKPKG
jgi:hypothetical protein